MGGLERTWGITKHEVVIQLNPIGPANYTTIHAKVVVTQVTSYDVLVGGQFSIPWDRVTLDFWDEITYY
jgi:hypothetical protein